jgi:hypothetical protein
MSVVSCPQCHRSDSVHQVSAIVGDKTAAPGEQGSRPTPPFLAQMLRCPVQPAFPPEPHKPPDLVVYSGCVVALIAGVVISVPKFGPKWERVLRNEVGQR